MITFDQVTKRYDDGTVAVDNLSLECATGEITMLVGTSGCGKTTSLRMINRLVEPTSGTIAIDGHDVTAADPAELRRGIGYVIQQGGLFPHRTVVDNIATVPRLLGTSKAAARNRAHDLLGLVGLPANMANRYPHQLSGGQQQRVGVARALAADPPILLMDEPFSAVDPIVRDDLQREMLALQAELHKTVVFVTHDIDEAIKLGDKVAVMQVGGHLAQFDTPEAILARPASEFVEGFLGHDRGIRWLSFFAATRLPQDKPATIAAGATIGEARRALEGQTWLLVIDAARKPLGWLKSEGLTGDDGATLDTGALLSVGHTYCPDTDTLRAALDAAVLSPAGLAVAVDGDGALTGVTTQAEVSAAIRDLEGRA